MSLNDCQNIPHLIKYVIKSYPILSEYYGSKPYLKHIHSFWTNPSPQGYRDTHDWHIDPGSEMVQLIPIS